MKQQITKLLIKQKKYFVEKMKYREIQAPAAISKWISNWKLNKKD